MALQSSGTITFSQVNVELGVSATATISLNDAAVRALFQVPSGSIALSNGYGKSKAFIQNIVLSTNIDRYNLRDIAIGLGWNQSEAVTISVVINSGVYIYSSTTGTPAFTVGSFPAGSTISITNNGTIVGMGGAGGASGVVGSPGGGALLVSSSITLTNNGTIAGGGGGGGAGSYVSGCGYTSCYNYPGGGGGGGRSGLTNSAGGAETASQSASGTSASPGYAGGVGTVSGPGGGGQGCVTGGAGQWGGNGGSGGNWGASGSVGGPGYSPTSSQNVYYTAGGAGGYCTSGSSYITWIATGTRYGSIS